MTETQVRHRMVVMVLAFIMLSGPAALLIPYDESAGADPVFAGSQAHHTAVWDFSTPSDYDNSNTVVAGGDARLKSQSLDVTDEAGQDDVLASYYHTTTGDDPGNLTLGISGEAHTKKLNITDARFNGGGTMTNLISAQDADNQLLDENEFIECAAIENFPYSDDIYQVLLSVTIDENQNGGALAVQFNTGSGWTTDLNISSTTFPSWSTYWMSLSYYGVDTITEINALTARVYMRDPTGDGGNPERIWVDEIKVWVDYNLGRYHTSGTCTSPVMDTAENSDWGSMTWNGGSNGPGTNLTFQARAGPSPASLGAWSAVMWGAGSSPVESVTGRYVQYRAELTTTNFHATPMLINVTLFYSRYLQFGTVETNDVAVADLVSWDWVTYNETTNGGTTKFWYSVDSGQSWTTLFSYGMELNSIPGSTGKVRFKVDLTTADYISTPVIHDIHLGYTRLYEPKLEVEYVTPAATADCGETITVELRLNNTGNAPALNVSATMDLPDGFTRIGDTMTAAPVDTGSGFVWGIGTLGLGLHTFDVNLKVGGGFDNGTTVTSHFTVDYEKYTGKSMTPEVSDKVQWTIHSPVLTGSLTVDKDVAQPEEMLNYTLEVRNDGMATAYDIDINMLIPNSLAFMYSQPYPNSNSNGTIRWVLKDGLMPGGKWSTVVETSLDLDAKDGALVESRFNVTYVDGNLTSHDPFRSGTAGTTVYVPPIPEEEKPWLLSPVPNIEKPEDSLPWVLELTNYERDVQDSGTDLKWYITGENNSLYFITSENSSDDRIKFIPVPDAYGEDLVRLHLRDSEGYEAVQNLWVNITPINDAPVITGVPDLNIHYEFPYRFNLSFYMADVETTTRDLALEVSDPDHVKVMEQTIELNYPRTFLGRTVPLEISVYDGEAYGTQEVRITISENFAPRRVGPALPEVHLVEGATRLGVFDLYDYFVDPDGGALNFTVFGNRFVNITINESGLVDFGAPENWSGVELTAFRAIDPGGAIAEDFTLVIVIAQNDPPNVTGVPDLYVHPDMDYIFDLSPYVTDPDNDIRNLYVTTSRSHNIKSDPYNNLLIVINFPEKELGSTLRTVLTVSDGFANASDDLDIHVTSNVPPVLLQPLPDLTFDEDVKYDDALDLTEYFADEEGNLTFQFRGISRVHHSVRDGHLLDLWADDDWYGTETVVVRAVDLEGALREDIMQVAVNPVNDAPVLSPIPEQTGDEGQVWSIDLSEHCIDVDDVFGTLNFTTNSSYVFQDDQFLVFTGSADTPPVVRLTVSDGSAETAVNISVTINRDPAASQDPETVYVEGGDSGNAVYVRATEFIRNYSYAILTLIFVTFVSLLFFVYKTIYHVEEVFLIHKDKGIVINYLSNTKKETFNKEIIGSMLPVFQSFVEDAFLKGGNGRDVGRKAADELSLKQFSIGDDRKVMLEVGAYLYVAIIYVGTATRLRMRTRKVIRKLERAYGEVLEYWDGDMDMLEGTADAFRPLLTTPIKKDIHELYNAKVPKTGTSGPKPKPALRVASTKPKAAPVPMPGDKPLAGLVPAPKGGPGTGVPSSRPMPPPGSEPTAHSGPATAGGPASGGGGSLLAMMATMDYSTDESPYSAPPMARAVTDDKAPKKGGGVPVASGGPASSGGGSLLSMQSTMDYPTDESPYSASPLARAVTAYKAPKKG